jgi:CDGSH-type Zn-finger protein
MTTTAGTTAADGPRARLVPLPAGPYEVTGTLDLVDRDGRPIEPPVEQIYLCRCGRSANKPFCDGSHTRTGWTEEA